jgi:hypothetical protein
MYAEMVTTQEPVLKADALKENTIYLLDSVRGHAIPCIKVGDLLVMLPETMYVIVSGFLKLANHIKFNGD